MQKILFLTTSHFYNDDRIFYHQAKELVDEGFEVKICSFSSDFMGNLEGIEIESYTILQKSVSEKIKLFKNICENYQPNSIICSEPLAIIAANKFRKNKQISIIYDITEWYPSNRMVKNHPFYSKYFHWLKFFIMQLYAGFLSDKFIFGEKTKKFPLAYFFPFKKNIVLPYFPDEKYIQKNINKLKTNAITLCYTGSFNKEKGIEIFFKVADLVRKKRNNLDLNLLLIGKTNNEREQLFFENLLKKYNFDNLSIQKSTSFREFSNSLKEADICFDLRPINFENNNCLPIKLFYYIASGKPIIYSNLKAIRQHVDVSKFGYLVNPNDAEKISDLILNYIDHPEIYDNHAQNARKEYEQKYQWQTIKNKFVDFVTPFSR